MTKKDILLHVENVSYTYGRNTPFQKKAVDNVSFDVRRGSITGIIGHTGSGKSTLVQMLNGTIRPDAGEILLDGVSILWERTVGDPDAKHLRKKKKKMTKEERDFLKNLCFRTGIVFQYPEYQLFEETVYKDIAFGPKNMGLKDEEIDKRVRRAVEFVRLDPELLEKSPFELSGGQKRRVAIAGVIAMEPELLILDEPAAGLDPVGRSDIFGALLDFRDKTGATVMIVSHSMDDMAKYAEDLVVLSEGKCVTCRPKEEVFKEGKLLEEIGLSRPQITEIADKLREKGVKIGGETILTCEELTDKILALYGKGAGS